MTAAAQEAPFVRGKLLSIAATVLVTRRKNCSTSLLDVARLKGVPVRLATRILRRRGIHFLGALHGLNVMRLEMQEHTGYGELLCFVLAWVVGVAAIWSDYASRNHGRDGGNVAANHGVRDGSTLFE